MNLQRTQNVGLRVKLGGFLEEEALELSLEGYTGIGWIANRKKGFLGRELHDVRHTDSSSLLSG